MLINGTPVRQVEKRALITPPSLYGKRIRYSILEFDPLLDSSNMNMEDWAKLATAIEVNYQLYDAFVILHGTDTMAFSASALSFMLNDLGKTVILTGSQVPLAEVRNDAVDNLLSVLTIAGHYTIPEVCLFFNHKLFRGNRTSKVDAIDFNAFDSPNMRPLVTMGVNIDVNWHDVLRPTRISRFHAYKSLDPRVATLRIFPGITSTTVRSFLQPPIAGVVLETYGAGNAPNNRPDILAALREATARGVVIVNCTQCKRGLVSDVYATGKALISVGVVPGSDMTPECALTKLSYLLGRRYPPERIRELMRKSLRGELTTRSGPQRFSYYRENPGIIRGLVGLLHAHRDAVAATPAGAAPPPHLPTAVGMPPKRTVANAGDLVIPAEDISTLEMLMVPSLLCASARVGDVKAFAHLLEDFGDTLVSMTDYDGRTALHIAAAEGHTDLVAYLLEHGATVHARDRWDHAPLWDAMAAGHTECAKVLIAAGAHFVQGEGVDLKSSLKTKSARTSATAVAES